MRLLTPARLALLIALAVFAPHAAHATAFPLPPLVLLGDVPPVLASPDLIASMPHWLQVVLVVLGAVVPVASLAASFLSNYTRTKRSRGETVPAWMLALVAATNAAAINPHKAVRAARAAKGSGRGDYDVANDGKAGES